MHSFQSPLYRNASQKPFSFRKCLQERCKGHEKNFGVCRNAASVTKNFLAFAGMLQVPQKIFWHLQECCKRHEFFFGICRNAASVTKKILAFAGMLQVSRKKFWRLQERCKCHEKFFGICRNAASVTKFFLAFAGTLQRLKEWKAPPLPQPFLPAFSSGYES